MFRSRLWHPQSLCTAFFIFLLVSCGSGGGSDDSQTEEQPNVSSPVELTPKDILNIDIETKSLNRARPTRENAKTFPAFVLNMIYVAHIYSEDFISGGVLQNTSATQGIQTNKCGHSGFIRIQADQGGDRILADNVSCRSSSEFASSTTGRVQITITRASETPSLKVEFSDYSVAEQNGDLIEINGTISYTIKSKKNISVLMDLQVFDSKEGLMQMDEVLFETQKTELIDIASANLLSGTLHHDVLGYTQISNIDGKTARFSSANETQVDLSFNDVFFELIYSENNQGKAGVKFTAERFIGLDFDFFSTEQRAPRLTLDQILEVPEEYNNQSPLQGNISVYKLSGYFSDDDGDPLLYTARVSSAIYVDKNLNTKEIPSDQYSVEKTDYDSFQLVAQTPGTYELELIAEDLTNTQISHSLLLNVIGDNDRDGIADSNDEDDDNDGVIDSQDAFRFDPNEQLDTDLDGIGDNADPDDDNDLVVDVDDLFPRDELCSNSYGAYNGQCVLRQMNMFAIVHQYKDTLLMISGNHSKTKLKDEGSIARWSIPEKKFLKPYNFQSNIAMEDYFHQSVVHEQHGRIYFSWNSGKVTFLDIDTGLEGTLFERELGSRQSQSLLSAGSFILNFWSNHNSSNKHLSEIYDVDGTLIDSAEIDFYSSSKFYEDPITGRYNDVFLDADLDLMTGKLIDNTDNSVYAETIAFSPDRSKVILRDGRIIEIDSEKEIYNFKFDRSTPKVVWTTKGIGIKHFDKIERFDEFGNRLEIISSELKVSDLWADQNQVLIMQELKENSIHKKIQYIEFSDDTDRDGIINTEDAFPASPWASVDSDLDGYPDQLHMGYQENDDIQLDHYPDDYDCFRFSDGESGVCNIKYNSHLRKLNGMHSYLRHDGMMFWQSENSIYRYSIDENSAYTTIPISGAKAPYQDFPQVTSFIFDPKNDKAYFTTFPQDNGYGKDNNTSLFEIDLSTPSKQTSLLTFDDIDYQIKNILKTDRHFILAIENTHASDPNKLIEFMIGIYDLNMQLVKKIEIPNRLGSFSWDKNNERVLFSMRNPENIFSINSIPYTDATKAESTIEITNLSSLQLPSSFSVTPNFSPSGKYFFDQINNHIYRITSDQPLALTEDEFIEDIFWLDKGGVYVLFTKNEIGATELEVTHTLRLYDAEMTLQKEFPILNSDATSFIANENEILIFNSNNDNPNKIERIAL